MTNDDEENDRSLSRRELFRRAGLASAAAITLPAATLGCGATASRPAVGPADRREALEALTAAEAVTLEAIVARLIPSDASGPGATEARAAHYIDRARPVHSRGRVRPIGSVSRRWIGTRRPRERRSLA
jgi:hypothetical protein